MKRIVLFLALSMVCLAVNAQYYYYHPYYYPRYHRHVHERVVEKTVVVKERPQQQQQSQNIVVNVVMPPQQPGMIYDPGMIASQYVEETGVDITKPVKIAESPNETVNLCWDQCVWFAANSWKCVKDETNKMNLDIVGNFLRRHPSKKIILEGYASRNHGAYQHNWDLALNRVKTVLDYLANNYKIDWSRISTTVKGTDEQYFQLINLINVSL